MSLSVKRKQTSIVFICTFIILLVHNSKDSIFTPSTIIIDKNFRVAIVTLIRSTESSISSAINMIHSIIKFYPFKENFDYSLMIFHESNMNKSMIDRILFCVNKHNHYLEILFVQIDLSTSVKPEPDSPLNKPISYRRMCRFWSYDVFYHPNIVDGNFDYLMRMDDDSYFPDEIEEDFFGMMARNRLDYIYRSMYEEGHNSMTDLLAKYIPTHQSRLVCIYNNFFVMRLNWFYRSQAIDNFLEKLLENDLILRHYIGDGCVHHAFLLLEPSTNQLLDQSFDYVHNQHYMVKNSASLQFVINKNHHNLTNESCRTLAVVRLNPPRKIEIKFAQ